MINNNNNRSSNTFVVIMITGRWRRYDDEWYDDEFKMKGKYIEDNIVIINLVIGANLSSCGTFFITKWKRKPNRRLRKVAIYEAPWQFTAVLSLQLPASLILFFLFKILVFFICALSCLSSYNRNGFYFVSLKYFLRNKS